MSVSSISLNVPVAGSSEALLSGQKPPFRLFVRAVRSDGSRATHIRFAVSEAFVVSPHPGVCCFHHFPASLLGTISTLMTGITLLCSGKQSAVLVSLVASARVQALHVPSYQGWQALHCMYLQMRALRNVGLWRQVATPRVRTAAKADIPHVDDHVKMLAGLGNQTQQKLMDIQAAAAAVGVFGLQLPHNTVTKGGQSSSCMLGCVEDW